MLSEFCPPGRIPRLKEPDSIGKRRFLTDLTVLDRSKRYLGISEGVDHGALPVGFSLTLWSGASLVGHL
jgi:hypothetical protein